MQQCFRWGIGAAAVVLCSLLLVGEPLSAQSAYQSEYCADRLRSTPLVEMVAHPMRNTLMPDDTEYLTNLRWTPDGAALSYSYFNPTGGAGGVNDEFIYVWTLATDETRELFARTDEEYAITPSISNWSPDGRYMVLLSTGFARVIDSQTGRTTLLDARPLSPTLGAPVWSPDSRSFVLNQIDMLTIWNTEGQRIREVNARGSATEGQPIWTADGLMWIARMDSVQEVVVWNEHQPEPIFSLDAPAGTYLRILSPQGNAVIISDNFAKTLTIWNLVTAASSSTIHVFALSGRWAPNETCLLTTTVQNFSLQTPSTIPEIWDAATGELLQRIPVEMTDTDGIAWSPDGTRLAFIDASNTIQVWGFPD